VFCLQGVLSDELYSTTDPDELSCRIAIVELLIARKIEARNKRQNPDAMYNLFFSRDLLLSRAFFESQLRIDTVIAVCSFFKKKYILFRNISK
jgi:hypothetical protein